MKKVSRSDLDMSEVMNQLFEGDCLEYMDKIPDGSVDMILCDLPYGMTQNEWDCYIPLDELWKQYNRVIKPNGAIALTSNGIFTAKLILSQANIYKYKWVWEKSKPTNFLNAKKQPLRKHEAVSGKEKPGCKRLLLGADWKTCGSAGYLKRGNAQHTAEQVRSDQA